MRTARRQTVFKRTDSGTGPARVYRREHPGLQVGRAVGQQDAGQVTLDQDGVQHGLRVSSAAKVSGSWTFSTAAHSEESPAGGQVIDCQFWADPVGFVLVAYSRISYWGPFGRGRLPAWGCAPWLGLRFINLFVNPGTLTGNVRPGQRIITVRDRSRAQRGRLDWRVT